MRITVCGDPHIQVTNLEESQRLIDFIVKTAVDSKSDWIWFTGDMFHNHSVVRGFVNNFWHDNLESMSKMGLNVLVTCGNHDYFNQKKPEMGSALDKIKYPGIVIVDKPMCIQGIAFMPYYHDRDLFVKDANFLIKNDPFTTSTLCCHQNFTQSLFGDMIEPELIQHKNIIAGHLHCYSEDTEFLTDSGWKLYDNISDLEKLVSLNMEKDELEYVNIKNRIKRELNEGEKAYHFKNIMTDLVVTERHTMIKKENIEGKNKYITFFPKEIDFESSNIPTASQINNIGIDLSDNEIRLLVWLIADGSISKRYPTSKSYSIRWHLKKERKIIRLNKLLSDMGESFSSILQKTSKTKINLHVASKSYENLIKWCWNDRKILPVFLRKMNNRQFLVFMEEYANTDGNYSNGKLHLIQICTKQTNEADLIQEMCHINNASCKLGIKTKKDGKKYSLMYINLKRTYSMIKTSSRIKEIDYSGKVVCFENKNGTLMVRRNGAVSISGNCKMDVGKVSYVGSPKWDSATDAGEEKGIWIFDFSDDGDVISKEFMSTRTVVTPIDKLYFSEGDEEPTLDPTARNYLEIKGQSAWVNKMKKKYKGIANIKAVYTDRLVKNKVESALNFSDFIVGFNPIEGVSSSDIENYLKNMGE